MSASTELTSTSDVFKEIEKENQQQQADDNNKAPQTTSQSIHTAPAVSNEQQLFTKSTEVSMTKQTIEKDTETSNLSLQSNQEVDNKKQVFPNLPVDIPVTVQDPQCMYPLYYKNKYHTMTIHCNAHCYYIMYYHTVHRTYKNIII